MEHCVESISAENAREMGMSVAAAREGKKTGG